jgi:hypothetical protein
VLRVACLWGLPCVLFDRVLSLQFILLLVIVEIYDKLNMSTWLYQRTYYDLFQVAITKKKYLKDGLVYIRKAHEAALTFTSDKDNDMVRKMKSYVDNPSSHRNYLILS